MREIVKATQISRINKMFSAFSYKRKKIGNNPYLNCSALSRDIYLDLVGTRTIPQVSQNIVSTIWG